jgi:hypothetical protein
MIMRYFIDPAGSGTPLLIGVRSTYIWGLQIGTQFCPDMIYRRCVRRGYGAADPSSSRIQD